ncbi:2-oxo acid dehydrogenase subunit E2 [Ruminococcaceae bacterium OttesenSCG-928-I18]|nr:2-oxo acid dehydrogenase subunit E2 [Ruminococcaceae bacterium OttesenSCG-928-I18]
MVKTIVMPKLGTTMKEGVLTAWHKSLGEYVKAGELLMTVESNKAQVDIDATASGYLVQILHEEGDEVPVTLPVGYLADSLDETLPQPGDGQAAPAAEKPAEATPPVPLRRQAPAPTGKTLASPKARVLAKQRGVNLAALIGTGVDGMVTAKDVETATGSAPKATPVARELARQQGVDLASIAGSGDQNRIMKADVQAAATSPAGQTAPLTGMRRVIADNMLKSVQTMAHAYHWVEVDMSAVAKARKELATLEQKLSYNDFIVLAAVRALGDFPAMNSTLTEEGLTLHGQVNLGVAVSLEQGLIVPNIKDAQTKNLESLHREIGDLATRAREGDLRPEEYKGGTFTVSNLGMFGLDGFFAIVNPPEVGILAAGRVADRVVAEEGAAVVKPCMTLSLTYDHRVVDGALAAEFLARARQYLEAPCLML